MENEIENLKTKLMSIVDGAEAEARDLTPEEEVEFNATTEAINKAMAQIQPITPTPEEGTEMTQATEVKTISINAPEELTLMDQIAKALPTIKRGESFQAEFKAISGTNTDATTGSQIATPAQWAGLVPTTLGAQNRLYNLVRRIGASGASVSFAQVGLADNKASKVKELGLKPESELITTSKTLEILTHAHWTEASKQVLDDVAGLEALIGSTLVEGLIRVVDAHIYTELANNATAFAPKTEGSDVFAEVSLAIQLAGGSNIAVAVNPADYLTAITAKSTVGEYVGLTPYPVNLVATPSVPVGKFLAFDQNAVAYFNRQDAGVFIGYHGNQFVSNAVTILAECRGVAGVLNGNLVLAGSLPALPKV